MAEIIENQAAYILHRRPFKENSLILDVFSLNYGRLSLVAKGANKVSKKGAVKAGMLQAFQPLVLSWSGRSSLRTLRDSEMTSQPYKLSGAYLYSGYYLNELLVYLTPEADAIPSIFVQYSRVVEAMSNGANLEQALRAFEYQLLTDLGLNPSFEHDALGQEIKNDVAYFLDVEQGFHPLHSQSERVHTHQRIYSGVLINTLFQDGFNLGVNVDAGLMPSAKILLRELIDAALQGRPLKSRDLYRQMVTRPVIPVRNK